MSCSSVFTAVCDALAIKDIGSANEAEYERVYAEYERVYAEFKRRCRELSTKFTSQDGQVLPPILDSRFFAYALVNHVLRWFLPFTQPQYVESAIANIRNMIEANAAQLAAGKITQEEHDALFRDCDERQYRLRSDAHVMAAKYNIFCETIVRSFLVDQS